MIRNFKELEQSIRAQKTDKKRIVLCAAQDSYGLQAVVTGYRAGVLQATLLGDESKIQDLLVSMGEDSKNYKIIHEPDEAQSAALAVKLVHDGRADIPMKGLMQSTTYLTAIAHPLYGLYSVDSILSESTVFHNAKENRMMIATDCALNVNPSLNEKVDIVKNAVALARSLGIEHPKVALLSAAETLNPQIPSDGDIPALLEYDFGQDVLVQGPLALDNAVSLEAARHKGIEGPVAGQADILLVPNLLAGNILHKSIHFFGEMEFASVMCGTTSPVIFNSRTDDPQSKYYSILVAIAQSQHS